MKSFPLIAAATLLALGAPALAQTPAAEPAASAPAPTEVPAGPTPEVIAAHQALLLKTIADLTAGRPNFDTMEPRLADVVRQQQGVMQPELQRLGKVQEVTYAGVVQGALKFRVAFAGGPTTWFIGLGADGRIANLVVRGG